MAGDRSGSPSLTSLLLVPALVTLAVTLVRLAGELLHWSPRYFARSAGGAFALVGIVWLVPIFAIYFAWRLLGSDPRPRVGAALAHPLLAAVLVVAAVYVAGPVLKLPRLSQFAAIILACVVAAAVAYRGWPALGRTLLAYGLAARVPVILVMLVAIVADWGTHYDVPPPNFPEMPWLSKWLVIGVVPQLLLWIPLTIIVGALAGALTLLVAGRGRAATA